MDKIEKINNENLTKNTIPSHSLKESKERIIDELADLQQQLIASERRALGLFELTNDAIFLIDLDGNYIDVNQRAAEMLGYNRHDIIGRPMIDFIAEEEKQNSKQKLIDLKTGRILPIYIRRFKRRDNTIFPAEINAAVVQDENGNPKYIQSAVRDISERAEAEDRLDRERKAFHLIAEASIYANNIKDLCQRIAEGITSLLDFDASSIRLYDPQTRLLIPYAHVDNIKGEDIQALFPQSIDDPKYVFALAAQKKRALIAPKFEDRSLLAPYQEHMNKMGILGLITWPILNADNDLLGVLQLISYRSKEIPDEYMIFFETIARLLTVAIERKRADDALKESEEKYRSFAQNFQGIAYRLKAEDNTPIFYNGAVKEITGYTEEAFILWNPQWKNIIHPDDKKRVNDLKKHLHTIPGFIFESEYRIIRKDKQVLWVYDISQSICNENNEPIFIQGAIYDISERKRNEAMHELHLNLGVSLSSISDLKQAFTIVLESITSIEAIELGCIHLVNNETGFLDIVANHGLEHDFIEKIAYYASNSPFTRSIMTGKPVYSDYNDIVDIEGNEFIINNGLHSLAHLPLFSDKRIIAILTLASKSSDTIPISTRNNLEIIISQIEGAIARIGAEEALRENEEKYRTFVQNFLGIAYRIDVNFKPMFLDGAIKEITGFNPQELMLQKYGRYDIIHPYDLVELEKKFVFSSKNPSLRGKHEYRIIAKDSEVKWVQDIWQVLINDQGEILGYQGSIYNITDRKLAQNELQKLYLDLEQRVEERTEQLTATNKELTAFSYSVSHDLRTPLRHIGGFAELLQKKVSTQEQIDEKILSYTHKIIESVEEMNKLIDGLLTFSRMSRVEMVNIKINLTELVQDVFNDFQVEIGNREIDLKLSILPEIIGDPSLLRLVLVNLIANAFKFTKKNPLTVIEIGVMPSKESDKATIFIRDNGVGFDMKYYDRLFGVFQRLHKNEEFEGSGIGLATVQRIIRRMGGSIWAESAVNQGATFYFSIPKAIENGDEINE
ncbi:MAG: PAS domain S-box protein [Candidatus Heimdallarchaeota archaeon]|nr:PAS domain S-box protein [Candidatus Heimdallarchaeota archaeon]